MSITSDLRAQLNDVTETATGYVEKARGNVQSVAGKAGDAVNDLRATAEKAINLDAIKSAVEPYVSQVKHYGETVVATVNARVVTPVLGIAGRGRTAKPAPKATARPATKATPKRPATTKPAGRTSTKSATPRKSTPTSAS